MHNGKFGFCFVCLSKADYYCRNNRLPICSINCKYKLYDTLKKIKNPLKKNKDFDKGFLIIRYLIKLVKARNKETDITFRIYVLKILKECLSYEGEFFYK